MKAKFYFDLNPKEGQIEGIEKENRRLYDDYYKDTNARMLSNIENHDKAILSLSTATLGVSLAFMKDVIPIDKAVNIFILEISWSILILAIISVIFSFFTGNKASLKHLKFAEDYYINGDDKAIDKVSKWFVITEWLNYASGAFFILGIIFTAIFVNTNITNKGNNLNNTNIEKGANASNMKPQINSSQKVNNGATPPKMQIKPTSNVSKK